MSQEIELLREMLSVYSPSRKEAEMARFLAERMQSLGFQAYVDGAGNAVGEWGAGERTILLLGHMDTVPGFIPVEERDGLLYGRGAVDAKGPLAAFISAITRIPSSSERRILVVGAVEEEGATSKGAHHLVDEAKLRPEAVIIGEPSGWSSITLGYKGRLVVEYRISQEVQHGARGGLTACERGVAFWNSIVSLAEEYSREKEGSFPRLDASLRRIASTSDGFTETLRATIGLRIPLGMEVEALKERVRDLAEGAKVRFLGEERPYQAPKNTALVRALVRAIRAEGGTPTFKLKTGTSDMNVVGPAWGCPIVAYGPGDSSLDHTPDEHINLGEYEKSIQVLARALREL